MLLINIIKKISMEEKIILTVHYEPMYLILIKNRYRILFHLNLRRSLYCRNFRFVFNLTNAKEVVTPETT